MTISIVIKIKNIDLIIYFVGYKTEWLCSFLFAEQFYILI